MESGWEGKWRIRKPNQTISKFKFSQILTHENQSLYTQQQQASKQASKKASKQQHACMNCVYLQVAKHSKQTFTKVLLVYIRKTSFISSSSSASSSAIDITMTFPPQLRKMESHTSPPPLVPPSSTTEDQGEIRLRLTILLLLLENCLHLLGKQRQRIMFDESSAISCSFGINFDLSNMLHSQLLPPSYRNDEGIDACTESKATPNNIYLSSLSKPARFPFLTNQTTSSSRMLFAISLLLPLTINNLLQLPTHTHTQHPRSVGLLVCLFVQLNKSPSDQSKHLRHFKVMKESSFSLSLLLSKSRHQCKGCLML